MPGKKRTTILGKDQKALRSQPHSRLARATLDQPLKDTAGAEHRIDVRMDVTAAGNALEFRLHLDNRTDGKVREAWYPMIGGLAGFAARESPPMACSGFRRPNR